jgi:hypothetical protein
MGVRPLKKLRISIVVELDVPDSTTVTDIVGEHAFRIGDVVLRPGVEFHELVSSTERSSSWMEPSEETYDIVQGAIETSRTTLDLA